MRLDGSNTTHLGTVQIARTAFFGSYWALAAHPHRGLLRTNAWSSLLCALRGNLNTEDSVLSIRRMLTPKCGPSTSSYYPPRSAPKARPAGLIDT
jgi:hypothetical protein